MIAWLKTVFPTSIFSNILATLAYDKCCLLLTSDEWIGSGDTESRSKDILGKDMILGI